MDYKSTVNLIPSALWEALDRLCHLRNRPHYGRCSQGAEMTADADYPDELDERHIAERLGTIRLTATALATAIKKPRPPKGRRRGPS
jgi:hypothetical protein